MLQETVVPDDAQLQTSFHSWYLGTSTFERHFTTSLLNCQEGFSSIQLMTIPMIQITTKAPKIGNASLGPITTPTRQIRNLVSQCSYVVMWCNRLLAKLSLHTDRRMHHIPHPAHCNDATPLPGR